MNNTCNICYIKLCNHPIIVYSSNNKVECKTCNATDLTRYCLPYEDGEVNFESDVFIPVCKDCHDKYQK